MDSTQGLVLFSFLFFQYFTYEKSSVRVGGGAWDHFFFAGVRYLVRMTDRKRRDSRLGMLKSRLLRYGSYVFLYIYLYVILKVWILCKN